MKAADIMTSSVVTIADDATVNEAAEQMLKHRISALPVVNCEGRLVGIISEGDLVRRAEVGTERARPWWLELLTSKRRLAAEYVKSHAHTIRDVMTCNVVTAAPNTPISEISRLLETHAIKRVPITDGDKLVGVVSRANVIQGVAGLKSEASTSSSDRAIRESILETVRKAPWRPWLWNVTVSNGVVDLWGVTESLEEKQAVGTTAENTPGVVLVNNNLVVAVRR
jgi:CBS domain-containing protein